MTPNQFTTFNDLFHSKEIQKRLKSVSLKIVSRPLFSFSFLFLFCFSILSTISARDPGICVRGSLAGERNGGGDSDGAGEDGLLGLGWTG